VGDDRGGRGAWRASDRGIEHDPCDPRGVERARSRSAGIRTVRVRRERAVVRSGHGGRSRHPADRGAALRPGFLLPRASLWGDVEYHYARTFRRVLREADASQIGDAWDALSRQAAEALAADGFVGASAKLKRSAALHYKGQTYELVVPLVDGPVDAAMVAYLE